MKDWQNLFKPEDFRLKRSYHDQAWDYEHILETISNRANEIVRSELLASGVVIKMGNKTIGTKDMVGRVVDVRLAENKNEQD